ncbi:MAG: hypothetical protein QOE90_1176 [Thermoplasmata archaeon]|jgi:hypothetical protein|nr:hypothetical protein [Thermoplasmata archaeon]
MRIVILAAMLLLATTVFVTAAPSADAFGTCTVLSGTVQPGPHCPGLACIGTSWSYGDYYYDCQYEIPYPCQYCVPLA